jgi:hypothetical protein
MRSDAAPPIDQAITPTWTGAHVFTSPRTTLQAAGPRLVLHDTAAPLDEKQWQFMANASQLIIYAATDAGSATSALMVAKRTGTALGACEWRASQMLVVDGTPAAPALAFISAPGNGLYAIGTTGYGFSVGGVLAFQMGMASDASRFTLFTIDGTLRGQLAAVATAGSFIASSAVGDLGLRTQGGSLLFSIDTGASAFLALMSAEAQFRNTANAPRVTIRRSAGGEKIRMISEQAAAGSVYLTFYDQNNTTRKGYLGYGNASDDTMYMMNEKSGATIQLGVASTPKFTVDSALITAGVAMSAPSYTATSSRAMKRGVRPVSGRSAVRVLERLAPVFYRWRDRLLGTDEHLGLIAEDVHKVCPQLTNEEGNAIRYDRLAILLLAAWQGARA